MFREWCPFSPGPLPYVLFRIYRVSSITSFTKAATVRQKHIAEPPNPMMHKKAFMIVAPSSPAPHPHNFVRKHKHNFKCAAMLHTEKTIDIQSGLLVADDCEPS